MKVPFETCGLGFLGRAYSGQVFLGGNSFRVLLKGIVSLCGDPRDGQGFSGGASQVKTLGEISWLESRRPNHTSLASKTRHAETGLFLISLLSYQDVIVCGRSTVWRGWGKKRVRGS